MGLFQRVAWRSTQTCDTNTHTKMITKTLTVYVHTHTSASVPFRHTHTHTDGVVPAVDGKQTAAGDGDGGGDAEVRQRVGRHVGDRGVGGKLEHHDDVLLHLVLEHQRTLGEETLMRQKRERKRERDRKGEGGKGGRERRERREIGRAHV